MLIALYGAALSTFIFVSSMIQTDDVKLIVNGTVEINGTRDASGDVETVTVTPKSLRMTFSDAGNRAITINSVSLTADQMDHEGKYQPCQRAPIDLEPVQLKPGDITIRKEIQVSGGRLSYKPCDIRDPKGDVSIRVAPVFDVITPDNENSRIGEPLQKQSFGRGASLELSIVVFDPNAGLPSQTLYHHDRVCIPGWRCSR
jgi:hypothetical protein